MNRSDAVSEDIIREEKLKFGEDVSIILTGIVIAGLITIILTPLITSLFTPEAFGAVAVCISLASVFAASASFKFDAAILHPHDDESAGGLLFASIFCISVVSIIMFAVLLFFDNELSESLKFSEAPVFLLLVPVLVFIDGTYTVFEHWNLRKKRFRVDCASKIECEGGISVLKIIAGALTAKSVMKVTEASALFIAHILGRLCGLVIYLKPVLKHDRRILKNACTVSNIKTQAKHFIKFPIYYSIGTFFENAASELPVIVFAICFTSAEAGLIGLIFAAFLIPLKGLQGSFGPVFEQRGMILAESGRLKYLYQDVSAVILKLSIFPFLALFFLGDSFFVVFCGAEWSEAGVFIKILALWLFFWFNSMLSGKMFLICERLGTECLMCIGVFILAAVSLAVGVITDSSETSLILFAVTGAAAYSSEIYLSYRFSGSSFREVLSMSKNAVSASIFLLIAVAAASIFTPLEAYMLLLVIAVFLYALYLIALFRYDTQIREYFPSGIMKNNFLIPSRIAGLVSRKK